MSFITRIFSSSTATIAATPALEQPKSCSEILKKNISDFAVGWIEIDACIQNCDESVKMALCDDHYGNVDVIIGKVESLLKAFDQALSADFDLCPMDLPNLKNAFKNSCYDLAKKEWAAYVAKSFYPILSIPDGNRQIAAAQKWTSQFVEGVDSFKKWDDGLDMKKLQAKTLKAFNAHSQEMLDQQMRAMHARVQMNPEFYEEMLKKANTKAKKDLKSLSALEKEYYEFDRYMYGRVTSHEAKLKEHAKFLSLCIHLGLKIQQRATKMDFAICTVLFRNAFLSAGVIQEVKKQSCVEVFKENLSLFANHYLERDECVEYCVNKVNTLLPPGVGELSDASRKTVESYFESFSSAVMKSGLGAESKALNETFKIALCDAVEEKWAIFAARSFYDMIAAKKEQIVSAQKWTDQFFRGLECFNNWENSRDIILSDFINKLKSKTIKALGAHFNEIFEKKWDGKDREFFHKKLDGVIAVKHEPSLSIWRKEYDEWVVDGIHSLELRGTYTNLLTKFIWNGFTLREYKNSILDSTISKKLFEQTFLNP